ncbi:MAG: HD-GYP domain-containing protein [Solirubrobacterales bacterium]
MSDAVRVVANGNVVTNGGGNGNGNGNGLTRDRARRIAGDIGAAILADVNEGTAEHSADVVLITEAIGERMKVRGEGAGDLLAAARLHDIGKAWIPPELLEKPAPLTAAEWKLMRQHTLVGERILSSVDELDEVARLVRHSHERWDGRGYPDGLAGTEIPLGSRIIFCADAFHAIRCDRPYRPGRSAREAVAEISRCAGTQFDPRVASALEQVVRERSARPRGTGGSTRLLALLMCLVLGGAGSAIARSGLLPEPSLSDAQAATAQHTPPACGTAACPTVAGPVGGLGPVGAHIGQPGPRPLFPGLPGQIQRAAQGNNGKHKAKGHHKASESAAEHGKGKHKGHNKAKHGNGNHGSSSETGASQGNSSSAPGRSYAPAPSSSGSSHSGSHSSHQGSSRGGSRGRRGGGSSGGNPSSNAGGNGNGNANGLHK